MKKKLLISADDFGLSIEVNEAIEIAHRQGILNTTSLMIAGDAAQDAIKRAKKMPNLNVGLHLVVIEGKSISPHSEIPLLVDQNNEFPSQQVRMGINYFFNKHVQKQLEKEIRAQLQAFTNTGLKLDHVDVHKHMHLHPSVGRMLTEVGKEFSLKNIRLPREPIRPLMAVDKTSYKDNIGSALLGQWTRLLEYQIKKADMHCLEWCFGLSWCGHMTFERIEKLIPHIPNGRSEMFFHPATNKAGLYQDLMPDYEPVQELEALCNPDFLKLLKEYGITPITWDNAY